MKCGWVTLQNSSKRIMSKKVFIGLSDIASFIDDWHDGFVSNGIQTNKGSFHYQAPVQSSKLDFIIKKKQDLIPYFKPGRISVKLKPWWDKLVRNYYFKKAVKNCDIFLFIWDTFYPDYVDLEILKKKNKKIIVLFVGDDVRWHFAMKQEFEKFKLPIIEYENYDYSIVGLEKRLRYLRNVEKYADIILSQPNLSQLLLRPYYNLLIPIKYTDYKNIPSQRTVPKIVHAPTSVGKGSKYIIEAINQLAETGVKFEFEFIQNRPRHEAIKIFNDADIIIDQVLTPGGGKLAHEGLAMGKVVLTLMAYNKYKQNKPIESPLIDVDQNNLFEVLSDLIPDLNRRREIATKGRQYIEKYHNPKYVVKEILKALDKPEDKQPDFFPVFFRNEFFPESTSSYLDLYNKWTNYVKDCEWYKRTIVPGEREGLIF